MCKYVDNLSVKKKTQHVRCWVFNVSRQYSFPHRDVREIVYNLTFPCGKAFKSSILLGFPDVENRLFKKEQRLT